jgi:hypothetical protein
MVIENDMAKLNKEFYFVKSRNLVAKGSALEYSSNAYIPDFAEFSEDLINIRSEAIGSSNLLSIPQPKAINVILKAWEDTFSKLEERFNTFLESCILPEINKQNDLTYLAARGNWLNDKIYYTWRVQEIEKNKNKTFDSEILRKEEIFIPDIEYGIEVISKVIQKEINFNETIIDELKSIKKHIKRFKY